MKKLILVKLMLVLSLLKTLGELLNVQVSHKFIVIAHSLNKSSVTEFGIVMMLLITLY